MKKRALSIALLLIIVLLLAADSYYREDDPLAHSRLTVSAESSFSVHFIDVGQADSILVLCDGEAMLVDGGESSDSQKIYTYLKNNNIDELKYLVMTHPHSDHIGGIPGALNYAKAKNVLSSFDNTSGKIFESISKLLAKQGAEITVPTAGDVFQLGSASVEVIGPVGECADVNNSSLVLRVEYGKTSFLLTGDAEKYEIENSVSAGYYIGCDVYKVGHHGSFASLSDNILSCASPTYAVISCGKDNPYGHPTDEALSALNKAGVQVLRTDMQGDIIFYSDGKKLTYKTARNEDADTNPAPAQSDGYILNTRSMKFHLSTCSKAKTISTANMEKYNGSREKLIKKGYSPCLICNP